MRSQSLLSDLTPQQQAKRQQEVVDTLLAVPRGMYESMSVPAQVFRGEVDDIQGAANQFSFDYGFLPALGIGAVTKASPDVLRMGFGGYHGSPHNFPPAVRVRDKTTGRMYVQEKDDPVLLGMMNNEPDRYEIVGENPLGMFDISKVGTGEGAQAYGVGHYLSGSEGIAKGYRDALAQNTYTLPSGQKQANMTVGDGEVLHNYFHDELNYAMFTRPDRGNVDLTNRYAARKLGSIDGSSITFSQQSLDTRSKIRDSFSSDIAADIVIALDEAGDPDEAIKFLRSEADKISKNYPAIGYNSFETSLAKDMKLEAARQLEKYVDAGLRRDKGSMYEVSVAADPEKLLDYDKPLKNQPPNVKKAISEALDTLTVDDAINLGFDPFEFGGDAKKAIAAAKKSLTDDDMTVMTLLGTMRDVRGQQGAMEKMLGERGVAGLKYSAGGYRNLDVDDPNAVKNYVIFDESLMDIIRKYGLLGPLVGTGAAAGIMSEEEQVEAMKQGLLM